MDDTRDRPPENEGEPDPSSEDRVDASTASDEEGEAVDEKLSGGEAFEEEEEAAPDNLVPLFERAAELKRRLAERAPPVKRPLDFLGETMSPPPPSALDDEEWEATDDDDDSGSKVIDFATARRALEGGIPDEGFFATPIGQYIKEHVLPKDFSGQGNVVLPPDFLQEHGRPLIGLLFKTAADSLVKRQAELDGVESEAEDASATPEEETETTAVPEAAEGSAASASPDGAAEPRDALEDDRAASASPAGVSAEARTSEGKKKPKTPMEKQVSVQVDLGSFFRSLFGSKKKGED